MSARTPNCFYCRKKGLPSDHLSQRGTFYGAGICIVSLLSEIDQSNLARMRAEDDLAKLRSNPKQEAGSWAAVAAANRDAKVVAQIEKETAQIKAQEQAKARAIAEKSRQQYLEREAKRQEKKRVAEESKKAKENAHVANMIEKWGEYRWHQMVKDTEDDCTTASDIRYKEMEEDDLHYYSDLNRQINLNNDWTKESEATKKRRAEARATMTRAEFAAFEHQEWIDDVDNEEAYFASGYTEMHCQEKQRHADAERLTIWYEKQKIKEV
jgi:hypothetical protein